MKNLIERRGKSYSSKTIKSISPKSIACLSSDLAWNILNTISEKPMYPNEIARFLGENEQKIYYHIRQLEKAGIIEVVKKEDVHGSTSKYYSPTADSFGVELPRKGKSINLSKNAPSQEILNFFSDFTKDDLFNGSIVVGSPTQHGPYLTAAKDGHFSVQLGMFLGSIFSLENKFIVKLDTEIKAEEAEDRNMVLIGGPVTNIISNDVNDKIEIKFEWENTWSIYSKNTEKRYNDESDALIAKIKNPWDKEKSIILLWGIKAEGTKTSILALTQKYEKLLKDYNKESDFYAIIRGLDKDGDGKVDDIKILEIIN